MASKVLIVGQCGFDYHMLARLIEACGGVPAGAETASSALQRLHEEDFALVLVNRVIEGDGSAGMAVIGAMKSDAALSGVPVMLVSDYEEAQALAAAGGALPGFGKSQLREAGLCERIRRLLEVGE